MSKFLRLLILLWVLGIGTIVDSQTTENVPYIVSVSPDETMVAVIKTDQTFQILDSQVTTILYNLQGIEALSLSVSWSPNSRYISVASLDGIVRIWCLDQTSIPECTAGTLVEEINTGLFLRSVAWSSIDKLAVGGQSTHSSLAIFDVNNNFAPISSGNIESYALAWHPTQDILAVASVGAMVIFTDTTNLRIYDLSFSVTNETYAGWTSVAWNHDGTLLAGGMEDGSVYIMDVGSENIIAELNRHTSDVYDLVWSPDDIKLASTELTGEIVVWDLISNESYLIDTMKVETTNLKIDWTISTGLIFANNIDITGLGINSNPDANAGSDQTITAINGLATMNLDASESTDDVVIIAYSWSFNGTEIATGVSPQVTLGVGIHSITLTVTDDDGATATDEVVITVEASSACSTTILTSDTTALTNAIITANGAGLPQTICLLAQERHQSH